MANHNNTISESELKELIENYTCFYDGDPINEFYEDVLYSDNGCEYNFDDFDEEYFHAYEMEEYTMTSDIRDFIKIVNKCKKELNKFENGKSFFGLVKNEFDLYGTDDCLDELFDFNNLEEVFTSLQYMKFNRISNN